MTTDFVPVHSSALVVGATVRLSSGHPNLLGQTFVIDSIDTDPVLKSFAHMQTEWKIVDNNDQEWRVVVALVPEAGTLVRGNVLHVSSKHSSEKFDLIEVVTPDRLVTTEQLVDLKPEPATTHFDPDAPRPYTWTMLVTVDVSEMVVADGFDPFDPERDLSPRDVLDHIVGNVDSWGESHVEITSVQPIAIPNRSHIRRAQGYREADDISERDRKVIAETLRRVVDEATLDGVDIGDRLRDFCEAMLSDADGAYVQTAIDAIYLVEHGE
jgi:hypothetical protein